MTRNSLCNIIVAFFCGLFIGPSTYLLADRDSPFDVEGGRMVPAVVMPGDLIEVQWFGGNRHRDCPGTISRKLVDAYGKINDIEAIPTQYTNTGEHVLKRQLRVPMGMAPGEATYLATMRFVCNFTQKWWPIVVERPPVKFIVTDLLDRQGPVGPVGPVGPAGPAGLQGVPGREGPRGLDR